MVFAPFVVRRCSISQNRVAGRYGSAPLGSGWSYDSSTMGKPSTFGESLNDRCSLTLIAVLVGPTLVALEVRR